MLGLFSKKKSSKNRPQLEMSDEELNAALMRQIKIKEQEEAKANNTEDLSPKHLMDYQRSYHYKAVKISVVWQYGGRYGKTLADLGVKRGDAVELVCAKNKEDPNEVSVKYKGVLIGTFSNKRLRGMIRGWQKADLPIFAAVNFLGEEYKLILEIAFYGRPRKNNKE